MIDPKSINFSFSLLRALSRSPYHAVALKEKPKAQTSEQQFALAIECAIQEPDRFQKEYKIYKPDKEYKNPKSSKHYKETAAQYEPGKLLTEPQGIIIAAIKNNLFKNEKIKFIYENGEAQKRLEYKEKSGVNIKGFIDWYCHKLKIFSDLKCTNDASDNSLSKLIIASNWHVQAAIYRWLAEKNKIEIDHSLIVAVEYEFPFQSNIIELTDIQLDIGHQIFMSYLDLWTECVEKNKFPSYNQDIHFIDFPRYYERRFLGE